MKDETSHQDIAEAFKRIDALRDSETKRLDEKIRDGDVKYQIQFSAAEKALGIALTAQEKQVAAALEGTKEAIVKNDANTDKRFDLLSEKIDSIADTMSKSTGERGIYVTHSDLSTEMEKLRLSFEGMLSPVVTFMNSSQGKSQGFSASWGIILGAVGLTSTVILLGLRLSGH